jgi:DNA-binding transcriptional regulator/RsmH inhibitor MraZ
VDKQGRILIPERMLKRRGIGREVCITGAKDRLDLWNKADYEKFLEDGDTRLEEIQRRARQASRNRQKNGV